MTGRTGERDELATRLRALLDSAGISTVQAAERLKERGVAASQSKVSRTLTGKVAANPEVVAGLCDLAGASDATRSELVALAQQVQRGAQRLVLGRDPAAAQNRIGRFIRESSIVRAVATTSVPEELQTDAYIRAIFGTDAGVRLIDGLDGQPAAETIEFGLDGESYEIDLSEGNAAKLREVFAAYVAAARRVGSHGRSAARSTARSAGRQDVGRDQNETIREWARKQGIKVSNRGRIPAEVLDAYDKAGSESGPRRFVMILAESALGWTSMPAAEMAHQIDTIAAAVERRNVRVGIVPWGSQVPRVPQHGWYVFDAKLVVTGGLTYVLDLSNPDDVAPYVELTDELERAAVFDRDEVKAILRGAAERYRNLGN